MKKASKKLTKDFCRCIKKVRSYIKPRDSQDSQGSRDSQGSVESAAIAVCIKSVLQTKGKTLRKFSCRKGKLFTQKKKH